MSHTLSSTYHILSKQQAGTLQVALIVIMAQIGSLVPANFASMRLVDKLFTRIGTSDSIETNSSSFMVEMQETAHIVNHATERWDPVDITQSHIYHNTHYAINTSCFSIKVVSVKLHCCSACLCMT